MSSEAPDVSAGAPAIVETPGICGGSPRIYGTRLPIWGLAAARRAGRSDLEILDAYPALTPAALELAWDYIEKHRDAVEAEIRENHGF
ncbi:MAG TPA: DUF433 domain-containing protein [Pirellulales bacterium]|nr:DUF433 domain-containing protein [Pirellulales bacterium]